MFTPDQRAQIRMMWRAVSRSMRALAQSEVQRVTSGIIENGMVNGSRVGNLRTPLFSVLPTAPVANPPANSATLYVRLDAGIPRLYYKTSDGIERQIGLDSEQIRDLVAVFVIAGTGIRTQHNDALDQFIISSVTSNNVVVGVDRVVVNGNPVII